VHQTIPIAVNELVDAATNSGHIGDQVTDPGVIGEILLDLAEELAGADYESMSQLVADQDACELLLAKLTPMAE
jgi:hypothetical protein